MQAFENLPKDVFMCIALFDKDKVNQKMIISSTQMRGPGGLGYTLLHRLKPTDVSLHYYCAINPCERTAFKSVE